MSLKNVKVGDTLMYSTGYGGTKKFTKVVAVLKTQVKCDDGHNYTINRGVRVGTGNSYRGATHAYIIDEKAKADYIAQEKLKTRVIVAANTLRGVVVTPENVERVEAFLEGLKL